MHSLGQTLVRSIESRGSEITVRDSAGGALSGSATVERAFRVAHALRTSGLGPDDRVAIMGDDRVETIECYLGCFIAGVTAVHVNARLQSDEVEYILEDSDAKALIAGGGVDDVVGRLSGLDDLHLVRSIGGTTLPDYHSWVDAAPATRTFEERLGDAEAIIGYTSGTTGRPKGAIATERAVGGCLRLSSLVFRIPLRSSLAFSGSLSFIGATWGQVFPHLFVGGSVDLLGRYDL
ncbi:MAG TPA: AMP-binding protein, partial [Acidimicrobiales bacterium]|nr:AMP-binding protein [Acidimicrobiales bacterium]